MNLYEYAVQAIKNGAKCFDCDRVPASLDICHYDHEGGWKVDGYEKRQWIFFLCPRCKYQTSFEKLNVPKN